MFFRNRFVLTAVVCACFGFTAAVASAAERDEDDDGEALKWKCSQPNLCNPGTAAQCNYYCESQHGCTCSTSTPIIVH